MASPEAHKVFLFSGIFDNYKLLVVNRPSTSAAC